MKTAFAIVAMLLLAGNVSAVPVDRGAPDGVAARMIGSGAAAVFVTVDGRAFIIAANNPLGVWEEVYPNWPIPFQDVAAEFEGYFMLAADGTAWSHDWNWNAGLTWTVLPPLPVVPVSADPQNLGDVKSMFR